MKAVRTLKAHIFFVSTFPSIPYWPELLLRSAFVQLQELELPCDGAIRLLVAHCLIATLQPVRE